ncbi:MAG: twin-arginine translocase TatA/TatE family subunit [Rhodospirillales bacterium]|nr:twin-arginine translocase TatA/TatE family subunit [Rhodospirillales bacterium]
MGSFSIWHWLIVLVIVLLLFGKGKIPSLMGDLAKGVKAFKSGLKEEDGAAVQPAPATQPKAIAGEPGQPVIQKDEAVKH